MNRVNFSIFLFVFSTSLVFFSVEALEGQKMLGGDLVQDYSFNYQVTIWCDNIYVCGGGLISEGHVLTAAHCVVEHGTRRPYDCETKVVAGVREIYKYDASIHSAHVTRIFFPVKYRRFMFANDIAVLKLERSLTLGQKINKMKLPEPDQHNYVGETATLAGFGWNNVEVKIHKDGEYEKSNIQHDGSMRYAKATVLSDADCKNEWSIEIKDTNFCARIEQRSIEKSEGACKGDSGSPLVVNGVVIGVSTRGRHDCQEDKQAGVYMNVKQFLNLINAAMRDEPENSEMQVFSARGRAWVRGSS